MQCQHRGFTLIEVLVALVIVAVGMSALMGALSSSANGVTYMQDKTFSEWIALNQIANTRLKLQRGQVPAAGKTNGDLDFAGRSWHWEQEVLATPVQGIMRMDVKVRPKEIKTNDDRSWYVTVSGLAGNAVADPGSAQANIQWGDPGSPIIPNNTGPNTSGPNTGKQLGTPTPTTTPIGTGPNPTTHN